MNQVKVSVIMSVYNTQKYIAAAIESLQKQTLPGMEFLLINDGSTDDSGQIMDEYAKDDPRIRVIHKTNGGLSHSRNFGVREAVGEYIGFCDPDDWFDPDMYRRFYDRAVETEADVVVCGFNEVYEDTGKTFAVEYPFLGDSVCVGEQVRQVYLANNIKGKLHSFAWNKLYRRSFLLERNITSPEEMHLMQDTVFAIRLFLAADRAAYLDCRPYYFRRHGGSNSMKYRPDIFEIACRIYRERMAALEPGGLCGLYIKIDICGLLMRQCRYAALAEISKSSPNTREQKIEKLKNIAQDETFCEAYNYMITQNADPGKIVSLLRACQYEKALRAAMQDELKSRLKSGIKKLIRR